MSEIITIRSPNSRSWASIAPLAGFNAFAFEADCEDNLVPVIDSDPAFPSAHLRPSGHGIPLLFPFPNRIREGRFQWNGRGYLLPPERVLYDRTGNPIHGFCLDRPWRIAEQGDDFVTGVFRLSLDAPDRRDLWPADFELRATYRIKGAKLAFELQVTNPDVTPLPWGFGTHSYFKFPLIPTSNKGACLIEVPVRKQWVLTDCLPTGEIIPLPESLSELPVGEYLDVLQLDDAFEGLVSDSRGVIRTALVDEFSGLQMEQTFGKEFQYAVLFTPPNRNSVCIEPYTCMTDAINLPPEQGGWRVLAPGDSCRLWIDLQVSPIVA